MSQSNLSWVSEGLIPFRSTTLELVYGDIDYVRSVFGPGEVSRQDIIDYYDKARAEWAEVEIPVNLSRQDVVRWCRSNKIGSLHFYAPMTCRSVWFANAEDAFAFTLKFGN